MTQITTDGICTDCTDDGCQHHRDPGKTVHYTESEYVGYEAGQLPAELIEDLKTMLEITVCDEIRELANKWIMK